VAAQFLAELNIYSQGYCVMIKCTARQGKILLSFVEIKQMSILEYKVGTNVLTSRQNATTNIINNKIGNFVSTKLRTDKQKDEHTINGARLGTNSFFNSTEDAQKVLNAAHSGDATILSTNESQNRAYVKYDGVTGFYNNNGVITETNMFMIKGGKSASIVPIHPNTKNFK
jgi:hypothetical protein